MATATGKVIWVSSTVSSSWASANGASISSSGSLAKMMRPSGTARTRPLNRTPRNQSRKAGSNGAAAASRAMSSSPNRHDRRNRTTSCSPAATRNPRLGGRFRTNRLKVAGSSPLPTASRAADMVNS